MTDAKKINAFEHLIPNETYEIPPRTVVIEWRDDFSEGTVFTTHTNDLEYADVLRVVSRSLESIQTFRHRHESNVPGHN